MSAKENTSSSIASKSDDKSPVWKYFRKDDKKQKFAVCTLCQKAISAEYGNTSNLRKHIQSKHKSAFAELCKVTRLALPKDYELPKVWRPMTDHQHLNFKKSIGTSKIESGSQMTSDRKIVLQPISIVEDKGFKDFVSCLQPSYNIPDRWVLHNNIIHELHRSQKFDLQQKLNEIKSFAITPWTPTWRLLPTFF